MFIAVIRCYIYSTELFITSNVFDEDSFSLYMFDAVYMDAYAITRETFVHALCEKCTQNKTKGLFAKRKPYYQNESQAIVLLCTRLREWVHFIYAFFQRKYVPGMAAKEACRNHSYSRVHFPFCIRILQEHKEKD